MTSQNKKIINNNTIIIYYCLHSVKENTNLLPKEEIEEILSRFVAWVEKPSVEAAEFEFFDVISGKSGDLQSLKIWLYFLY